MGDPHVPTLMSLLTVRYRQGNIRRIMKKKAIYLIGIFVFGGMHGTAAFSQSSLNTEDDDFWMVMISTFAKATTNSQAPTAPVSPPPVNTTPIKRPYVFMRPPGTNSLPPEPRPIFPSCAQGCSNV